ncbi:MAG: rhodanese-related sulfurtransferase, partial [Rhodospirillales bacterium]|nr:rhodanese-related sulfurtransferase [Rhodospirillales bacterium]
MTGEDKAANLPICVAAFYKFAPMQDCAAVQAGLVRVCQLHGVKGTVILAPEGVNGTIAGTDEAVGHALTHIKMLPGCAEMTAKFSRAPALPFHRLKVRIKREIVTMGQPNIDPLTGAGHYVSPQDWNALLREPGTVLIDTRNDYEVEVGSFAGAINPRTRQFRDFPHWFRAERNKLLGEGKPPKVAMFCTGGIRCEKSTAFLRSEGVEEVYHLEGGILKYLEEVSPENSLWTGECFVFDQRVTVEHGLAVGKHSLCYACRRPVSEDGRASPLFEEGVSCHACHGERDEAQRASYRERHRQEKLAAERGEEHVGAQIPVTRERD